MKVTVLGCSGGYATPDAACSGYLVQEGETDFLMDLGAGALANLLRYIGAEDVTGMALSHLHYDHCVDIYGLCIARRYWESRLPPLPVILPADARDRIILILTDEEQPALMAHLDLIEAGIGESVQIGDLTITTVPAKHSVDAISMRVSAGEHAICYTGDTEMHESLISLAEGADLLICEANSTGEAVSPTPGHFTAGEAGELASLAGVGLLLLTHIWPTLDKDVALKEASETFSGPVKLASEGLTIEL